MADDFDFFNDEPKAKPKPKPPAPPPPPRAEPIEEDDYDDEPAPPPPRTRTASRRDRYDEPVRAERPRYGARGDEHKKKMSPLVLVAIIVGGLIVLGGGIVGIVLAVGGSSKPTEPKDKGNTTTATTKPAVTPSKKDKDAASDLSAPSAETVEKVKKATVKILVQSRSKKGEGGTGSGFVEKESRLVLTNAHVVGMKKITDPPPLINLVCNSGVGEQEYRLGGEVLAVDAENDLAIIRPTILIPGERTPVPDGLVVPKNSTVSELQKLFVFGFPLGDALGSEISIRPTQVTSLRHEGGKLKKIQVEGGMTFGNSGGPVVDVKGNVCGVAVSGIKDANINFCVPGEMVQQLLAKYKSGKE
jgi:S1-C subfamily serine protease